MRPGLLLRLNAINGPALDTNGVLDTVFSGNSHTTTRGQCRRLSEG
jgi:hypothetical protein